MKIYPKMLRKKSKAVPEGNDPNPQDAHMMLGGITLEELRRVMSETMGKALEEFEKDMRRINQRLASLVQDARQPRLVMEADVTTYKKTRGCTKSANAAVQAKHGDIYSAKRVQAGPKHGAAAPKSCLSTLEMCTPRATGGLLPTGKASTTTRITYNQPRLRFCPTEEANSKRTSVQYASYYSSFWRNSQLAAPFCRRVIETKSRQTLVFDPGRSLGHLRAYPFLGTWRTFLCGKVLVWAPDGGDLQRFLADE